MTNEEKFYLSVCIYHEARGEPVEGQIAVGHVILNRVIKRKKSIKEVVLQPYQFSWANEGMPPIKDYISFIECMNVADIVLEERKIGEYFYGSDHYFADNIDPPSWSKSMTFIKKIGRHLFFKS